MIKEYRLNLNLTPQALAKELGVTSKYLEALEGGTTDLVSLDFLNRVIMYFDIPVQHVLDSVRARPELGMWLAVQSTLSARVPPESMESIYLQVMAILNKLGEIWLKCPSVEEMAMWNGLILRNIESLNQFLTGWQEEIFHDSLVRDGSSLN